MLLADPAAGGGVDRLDRVAQMPTAQGARQLRIEGDVPGGVRDADRRQHVGALLGEEQHGAVAVDRDQHQVAVAGPIGEEPPARGGAARVERVESAVGVRLQRAHGARDRCAIVARQAPGRVVLAPGRAAEHARAVDRDRARDRGVGGAASFADRPIAFQVPASEARVWVCTGRPMPAAYERPSSSV